MLTWFVATAVLAIHFVFTDPRFDYRLLVVGAVVPSISDLIGGWAAVLGSVTVSVATLAVLMLATPGRKPIRSTLLGLPIGMFLHLVFGGAWADTTVFWWPFTGIDLSDARSALAARGWWSVPLEVAGVVGCVWIVRRARLTDPTRRSAFMSSGRLEL
ncbi:MAG: hypothetical protein RIR49_827 [Actinomycetota bacterium]